MKFIDWLMLTMVIGVALVTGAAVLGYIPDMGRLKWETKQLDTYLKVRNRQMPKE